MGPVGVPQSRCPRLEFADQTGRVARQLPVGGPNCPAPPPGQGGRGHRLDPLPFGGHQVTNRRRRPVPDRQVPLRVVGDVAEGAADRRQLGGRVGRINARKDPFQGQPQRA